MRVHNFALTISDQNKKKEEVKRSRCLYSYTDVAHESNDMFMSLLFLPDLGCNFGLSFPMGELEIQSQTLIPGLIIRTPISREVL